MVALPTLIHRVQKGVSAVELVYSSHPAWPLPPPTHLPKFIPGATAKPLRISVLDSSFNPPTLAHLALATTPAPSGSPTVHEDAYDAKLLLLSVRNADKMLAPGDATYVQRLEMMILLARDIQQGARLPPAAPDARSGPAASHDTAHSDNLAVAIIDEPTFVGKSQVLLRFLAERLSSAASPPASAHSPPPPALPHLQLIFLVGMDTLERLFAPRYYASAEDMLASLRRLLSSEGDDAWVVCARRLMNASTSTETELAHERAFMDTIQEFVQSHRVSLIDIGEEERTISSTYIRESRRRGDFVWRRWVTPSTADYVEQQNLYNTSCS